MCTLHVQLFTAFQNLYMYTNLTGCSNLVPSPNQVTPLHCATIAGKESTVQLLIEKGADINVKDNDGVRE